MAIHTWKSELSCSLTAEGIISGAKRRSSWESGVNKEDIMSWKERLIVRWFLYQSIATAVRSDHTDYSHNLNIVLRFICSVLLFLISFIFSSLWQIEWLAGNGNLAAIKLDYGCPTNPGLRTESWDHRTSNPHHILLPPHSTYSICFLNVLRTGKYKRPTLIGTCTNTLH